MVLSRARSPALLMGAALAALCANAWAAGGGKSSDPEKTPPPNDPNTRYVVRAVSAADLAIPPPSLPDLRPYNAQAIAAKIKAKPVGQVSVRRMVGVPALHEFVASGGRLGEWGSRQGTMPQALFLEGGYMTPRDLARAMPDEIRQVSPGVYLLRLPLLVQPGATLHIDPSVKEFRMSQERGAYLVNDGMLFITSSRVTSWSETHQAPAKYSRPDEFRPFILSWGGSQTYIYKSVVNHLGYDASKSYGVSISQYSPHQDAKLHRPRPTGWILDSTFSDNYYGFYCYEADDIVIARNKYVDNIVYGIDPHDRSNRLIIAENYASGKEAKHGIIISREVNDSWIFRNRAVGNKLAGIVLDRNSSNNVVAYNESSGNRGDGITIYESPDNLIWGNRSIGNERHGIRLRNSVDIRMYDNIVAGNQLAGIYGHTKDLSGTDRNLKLDPVEQKFSMVVVGGQIIHNGSGPVTLDRPLSVELYNIDLLAPSKKAGLQMTGVMGQFQNEILDILVRQRAAAVIVPAQDVTLNER